MKMKKKSVGKIIGIVAGCIVAAIAVFDPFTLY